MARARGTPWVLKYKEVLNMATEVLQPSMRTGLMQPVRMKFVPKSVLVMTLPTMLISAATQKCRT
jgi:hypothetical protein